MERVPRQGRVTQLLSEWDRGVTAAQRDLFSLVYEELRRLAAAYMRRERREHTLQPTALVHEAYLRLVDQREAGPRNRAQFLGIAAIMMRRVLLNHVRDRRAAKRGGGARRVSVTLVDDTAGGFDVDVLTLHRALEELAALDPRKSQIVELKFFGGLTTKEIGVALGVSVATVEREWMFARAWLVNAVTGGGERRPR
jgi:RNA polymerase sigma factor (TIGR02999 family)